MKRKSRKLTEEQKQSLLKSKYIQKVGDSVVRYTDEFKKFALSQYQQGKSPVRIFTDAKIDVRIIGPQNAFNLILKWRKDISNGTLFKNKNMSIEKQLEIANARIKYLEMEIEFIKKLQALEEE